MGLRGFVGHTTVVQLSALFVNKSTLLKSDASLIVHVVKKKSFDRHRFPIFADGKNVTIRMNVDQIFTFHSISSNSTTVSVKRIFTKSVHEFNQ